MRRDGGSFWVVCDDRFRYVVMCNKRGYVGNADELFVPPIAIEGLSRLQVLL